MTLDTYEEEYQWDEESTMAPEEIKVFYAPITTNPIWTYFYTSAVSPATTITYSSFPDANTPIGVTTWR